MPTDEGLVFLKLSEITRLEAKGAYTSFHLCEGHKLLASGSIGEWERELDCNCFFRVHLSHVVNLSYVKKFLKKDGGYLVLPDNSLIPVARRRKEEVLERLMRDDTDL